MPAPMRGHFGALPHGARAAALGLLEAAGAVAYVVQQAWRAGRLKERGGA